MKKILLLALSVFVLSSVYAQENYKLVVLPLMSPTIGDRPNPYLVSSALESTLRTKGISTTYKNDESSLAPCEVLFARISKVNSMFKCKVNVEFSDCMNNIIWSHEGVGVSKDFKVGYGEAIADALKKLYDLPVMADYTKVNLPTNNFTGIQANVVPASVIVPATPISAETLEYRTQQIYFGDSYIFDLQNTVGDDKTLVIINGESRGYKKLEPVAKLKSSDVSGIYNVEFTKPDGTVWTGMATESHTTLKISISNKGRKEEINLQKQ
ncbi:MAG: hypothetical protein ACK5L5_05065 [Bacteroidales bacterium]